VYRFAALVRVGLGILLSYFVYAPEKVIVRGLGIVKLQKQLENLIDWLGTIYKALPELELV